MPARDGKMGSYNLCGEEWVSSLLLATERWDNILSYFFLFFTRGSLGQTLTLNSEAHAFLFVVITPAWPKGQRKKRLVGSVQFGCFCGVTLNPE